MNSLQWKQECEYCSWCSPLQGDGLVQLWVLKLMLPLQWDGLVPDQGLTEDISGFSKVCGGGGPYEFTIALTNTTHTREQDCFVPTHTHTHTHTPLSLYDFDMHLSVIYMCTNCNHSQWWATGKTGFYFNKPLLHLLFLALMVPVWLSWFSSGCHGSRLVVMVTVRFWPDSLFPSYILTRLI